MVKKPGGVKCPFQEGPGDVEVKIPSLIGARAGKLKELIEPIGSVEVRVRFIGFHQTLIYS